MECLVCTKLSTLSCSRCKQAVYCSKECQTVDWKARHKRACGTVAPHAAAAAAAASPAVAASPAPAAHRAPLATRGGIPARAVPPPGFSDEVEQLLDRYRLAAVAQGFPRSTAQALEACAKELFRAAGVTPESGIVVQRLAKVTCVPLLPGKCYAAARNYCAPTQPGAPRAASYLEGLLFPEGTCTPLGHALVRFESGDLHDICREMHPQDAYYCAEFRREVYHANLSDPEFVKALEFEQADDGSGTRREGFAFPYIRTCLALGRPLG